MILHSCLNRGVMKETYAGAYFIVPNTHLAYMQSNWQMGLNKGCLLYTTGLFTVQSVGEFLDTHLFAASTFNIYFSRQQPNKWRKTSRNDFPLALLSEPTALSARVQNPMAFWEIWLSTEGEKLSLGRS